MGEPIKVICPECEGKKKELANTLGPEVEWEPCWLCQGEGEVFQHAADEYNGEKSVSERVDSMIDSVKRMNENIRKTTEDLKAIRRLLGL